MAQQADGPLPPQIVDQAAIFPCSFVTPVDAPQALSVSHARDTTSANTPGTKETEQDLSRKRTAGAADGGVCNREVCSRTHVLIDASCHNLDGHSFGTMTPIESGDQEGRESQLQDLPPWYRKDLT